MNVCYLLLCVLALGWSESVFANEHVGDYHNEWAVEIPGGERQARDVAHHHGYTLLRQLKSLPDHYLLSRRDVPSRSRRSASHHTVKLSDDGRVNFVAQQQQVFRNKRETENERNVALHIAMSGKDMNDPEGSQEWYLHLNNSNREAMSTNLGVKECWQKGFTGKNVTVTILDDGIEKNHPDLAANYDPRASYDLNDHDDDPNPRYESTNENKHGTRCAGEVSMVANNGKCGTGIAFNANIGGVRMLDGKVTDSLEGEALGFGRDHVDIYSSSWGPNDDGKTTEGPNSLAANGLKLGIDEGRGGKGSIYVWASGNGGGLGDNCNSDGYTSSIYTLSISSASEFGQSPWYSEKCSSTMATTYSSGGVKEGKVTSADLHSKCTNQHSGTSAAAPMAAGLVALLLEANPTLTWRDVQHIVAHTSNMEPVKNVHGWYKNGAGYCVNLAFGFGLMNAAAMVDLAAIGKWQHVGKQQLCKVKGVIKPQAIHNGKEVEVTIVTTGCHGQTNEVNYLEHIQVIVDIDYTRRGQIYVEVESPMGTVTPLMLERGKDASTKGFKSWPLMSVHTWGEKAAGTWTVRIADKNTDTNSGTINNVELVLMGTKEQPAHQRAGVKFCDAPAKKMVGPVEDPNKELDSNTVATNALQQLAEGLKNMLKEKKPILEDDAALW